MKTIRFLILASALTIFSAVAPAQRSFDFKNPKIPFSDQAVEKAIDKAVAFLLSRQQADGSWPRDNMPLGPINPRQPEKVNKARQIGASALALYALMEKGLTAKDPKIAKGLEWLITESKDLDFTYAVSFCCQVWLRAYKQAKDKDKDAATKYRKLLEIDVNKLIAGINDKGGYHYFLKDPVSDPSNAQYGTLGVWAGYRAQMEIPKEYWEKTLKYWVASHPQDADGSWVYTPAEPEEHSRYNMTAAAIATLFVCIDALKGDEFIKCTAQHLFAPVEKGLKWYDQNFKDGISKPNSCFQSGRSGLAGYSLYGLERIGLASGYKYFGDADWYKFGCIRLLNEQQSDGSWLSGYGPDVSTAYSVLFLIRGQHGVIMNRLEYDGDWNNRPRALANFCRWAEGVYEQEVNWQIITLKSPVGEWHDAPVVAISGSKAPKFSDEDIIKLRTYVNQGGTLFSMAECSGGPAFGKGMKAAYAKIFP
ncbi:MAG: DUF4159 domain-containing protein, partial [Planctomycetes bacterium]|nr:DUF4159 domain-containing protein [Planctomycetota bacterium]